MITDKMFTFQKNNYLLKGKIFTIYIEEKALRIRPQDLRLT